MDHRELTNSLLKSNVPPSETESKRFRELIRAEQAKYHSIAVDVEALSEQRQAIQDQIQAFKNVISPARRLPPETVTDIFRLCNALEDEIFPNPLAAPLLLTQICSGWRQVALQTPDLWTDLYFHVQENATSETHYLAKTWIERCRHHTFSMNVQSFDMLPDPFLDLLTIRPAMINFLELEIPHDAFTFLEKLPSEVVFPNLQILRVHPSVQNPDLEENWLLWPDSVRVFKSAPKLENVSMGFQVDGCDPASLHLPWHQLKELRLNTPFSEARVPYNNVRSILRKCTLLETCMVALDALTLDVDLNGIINLPHLERLVVIININHGTRFFESMALPQLKDLTLGLMLHSEASVFEGFFVDLQPLVDLQLASNFSLKKLVLLNMGVDQDELLDVLRLTRSLTDASFTFVRGLGEVFFSTLEDNSATAYLPCLSALTTDFSSIPLPNLQAILESRVYPSDLSTSTPPTVAKLERLALTVEVNFDQSVFEIFEGRGLKLRLDRLIGRDPTPDPEEELFPELE